MTDISNNHDALAHHLAEHLAKGSRRVWENLPAGPNGSIRPDVYTIEKSFAAPNPITYEVKVSRSDFLSDIKKGKWQGYLAFSYGVVFAAPKGLIKRTEVPEQCGLVQFNGEFWTTSKRPTIVPRPLDDQLMLKLIIEGESRETPYSPVSPERGYDEAALYEQMRKKFGRTFAQDIALVKAMPEEMAKLTSLKKELGELFNVPVDKWCFVKDIEYHVEQLREELKYGHEALRERGIKKLDDLKKLIIHNIDIASRNL